MNCVYAIHIHLQTCIGMHMEWASTDSMHVELRMLSSLAEQRWKMHTVSRWQESQCVVHRVDSTARAARPRWPCGVTAAPSCTSATARLTAPGAACAMCSPSLSRTWRMTQPRRAV